MSGVEEVLAAHSVEDYSEGEYDGDASLCCLCRFVAYGSDLYDAGYTHRAHVAEQLQPLIRQAQVEALREVADDVESAWLDEHVPETVKQTDVAHYLRRRADRLAGDA